MGSWILGYVFVGYIVATVTAFAAMDLIADEEELMVGLLRAVAFWPIVLLALLVMGSIELLAHWNGRRPRSPSGE